MLINTTQLKNFVIRAIDGDLGKVDEFYFDDETWAIRYMTVDTGGWLGARKVLISPISLIRTDWQARQVDVSLTKLQVENSPDINTHQPVSRQFEAAYLEYYGYGNYWGGPNLWGAGLCPSDLAVSRAAPTGKIPGALRRESSDSHLRSTAALTGYHIQSADGEIGPVEDLVMDDEAWAIRYVKVATRNWWPGKKVLFSPKWIQQASWADATLYLAFNRAAVKTSPDYLASTPITRDYESRLHRHYGQTPYWLNKAEAEHNPRDLRT